MADRALFREFRKDGWPLCPRCEEDELWSSVAIAATRTVTLEECWNGDFTCYYVCCSGPIRAGERYARHAVKSSFTNNRVMNAPWCKACESRFRGWWGKSEGQGK